MSFPLGKESISIEPDLALRLIGQAFIILGIVVFVYLTLIDITPTNQLGTLAEKVTVFRSISQRLGIFSIGVLAILISKRMRKIRQLGEESVGK